MSVIDELAAIIETVEKLTAQRNNVGKGDLRSIFHDENLLQGPYFRHPASSLYWPLFFNASGTKYTTEIVGDSERFS